METMKTIVTCAKCGGTDVQTVDWILPNTECAGVVQLAQGEPYSSSDESDTNWCNRCDAHVLLNYTTVKLDGAHAVARRLLRGD